MAEFTEVMKQAQRMCLAIRYCQECPAWDDEEGCGVSPDHTPINGFNGIEQRVTAWAENHPEPVYPSWEDGWKQIFPEAVDTPCPAMYGEQYKNAACAEVLCVNCMKRPMPAEIAERLGIHPKE